MAVIGDAALALGLRPAGVSQGLGEWTYHFPGRPVLVLIA